MGIKSIREIRLQVAYVPDPLDNGETPEQKPFIRAGLTLRLNTARGWAPHLGKAAAPSQAISCPSSAFHGRMRGKGGKCIRSWKFYSWGHI